MQKKQKFCVSEKAYRYAGFALIVVKIQISDTDIDLVNSDSQKTLFYWETSNQWITVSFYSDS